MTIQRAAMSFGKEAGVSWHAINRIVCKLGWSPVLWCGFLTHIHLISWWCYCIALTLGNGVFMDFCQGRWRYLLRSVFLVLKGNWVVLCLLILWMNLTHPSSPKPSRSLSDIRNIHMEEEARLLPLVGYSCMKYENCWEWFLGSVLKLH